MLVVDSSVWIAWLRGHENDAVAKLSQLADLNDVLLGDLVLLEVLQGARSAADAEKIEQKLRLFHQVQMLDFKVARLAAENFRTLRALGLRLRTTSDLIIGTYCIAHDIPLLHQDRDFSVLEEHLGLQVI